MKISLCSYSSWVLFPGTMRHFTCLIVIALVVGLQSCSSEDEGEMTVAEGILTNRITGEGVDGVPMVVLECPYGSFQGYNCDSLTSTLTKNGGSFSISFAHKKDKHYVLAIGQHEGYTSSEGNLTFVGEGYYPLESNKTNNINPETTPYQILKVVIETSKQGKDYLRLKFKTTHRNDSPVVGDILVDTVSQHQMISTTRYLKVLPQRNYEIGKELCNKQGAYSYDDCVNNWLPSFYFPNQDTVTINVN